MAVVLAALGFDEIRGGTRITSSNPGPGLAAGECVRISFTVKQVKCRTKCLAG